MHGFSKSAEPTDGPNNSEVIFQFLYFFIVDDLCILWCVRASEQYFFEGARIGSLFYSIYLHLNTRKHSLIDHQAFIDRPPDKSDKLCCIFVLC